MRPNDRRVWATWTFVAWHAWPEAPEHRNYLATPHRHLFHCRAELTTGHSDREVEFHDLLDACKATTDPFDGEDIGARSCEHIAEVIYDVLMGDGLTGERTVTISVAEDGENGATLTWEARPW